MDQEAAQQQQLLHEEVEEEEEMIMSSSSSQPEVRVSMYRLNSSGRGKSLSFLAGGDGQQEYQLWRIPEQVRAINRDAYEPKFVCIGPYHRRRPDGAANILPGEKLKKYYLDKLLEAVVEPGDQKERNKKILLQSCRRGLESILDRVRRFYGEGDVKDMKTSELVTMLLEDGCFIINHLYNYANNYNEEYLYNTRWAPMQLRIDLGLLENQIPFFVLMELFKILAPRDVLPASAVDDVKKRTLQDMVLWYMLKGWYPLPSHQNPTEHMAIPKEAEIHHMMHLVHLAHRVKLDAAVKNRKSAIDQKIVCWVSLRQLFACVTSLPLQLMRALFCCQWRHIISGDSDGSQENIASAKLLKDLGVEVKPWLPIKHRQGGKKKKGAMLEEEGSDVVNQNYGGVLDVWLLSDKITLQMPPLSLEQATAPLLQNLVAYEQQAGASNETSKEDYFTTYAFLLYNLVSTTEDVELLQERGILRNNYGSHDTIIEYFKNLCRWNQRSNSEDTPIGKVLADLRICTQDRAYRDLAELKQYVNTPVKLFLVIISAMITISTIWQTIYSLIYPKN
uniref:Uncharacterized protein n=1 Tax=Leersia perrieri TaxID=77586 RepID=A0A0D9WCD2_9ORYZ